MNDCIFCKIANKEMPKEFTYEDEDFMVFPDINPVKPIHLLVAPKKHIQEILFADKETGGKLLEVVQKMVKESNLSDKGYRLVANGGGAQHVDHLHVHLLGPMGQKVGW